MKSSSIAVLTIAAASFASSSIAVTGKSINNDVGDNEIRQVMSEFQQAIKNKKGDEILSLFVSGDAPVTASASDATIARIRAKKSDAVKILPSTSRRFASEIGTDKDASEENYKNIKIDSDGAVASVSFDFVYLSDGKEMNLGKEAWLLVKTDQGWKINSIVYSMNFPNNK